MPVSEIIAVVVLVAVHLQAWRLRWLSVIPRSRWLSAAGGISVAYVFVHLFPELADAQEHLHAAVPGLAFLDNHAYLVALSGLLLFYGLETAIRKAGSRAENKELFWLHLGSYALYNCLIGTILADYRDQPLKELVLFASAIALHFLVNDYGLRQVHQSTYQHYGRWLVSVAILVGWVIGLAVQIPDTVSAVLLAFLAGSVILNVLKEELPEDRRSRLVPFLLAAFGYSALLVAS